MKGKLCFRAGGSPLQLIPVWCLLRPFAGGEMFVQQVVSLVGILAGKLGAGAPLGQFDYSVEHLFQILVVRSISL